MVVAMITNTDNELARTLRHEGVRYVFMTERRAPFTADRVLQADDTVRREGEHRNAHSTASITGLKVSGRIYPTSASGKVRI